MASSYFLLYLSWSISKVNGKYRAPLPINCASATVVLGQEGEEGDVEDDAPVEEHGG